MSTSRRAAGIAALAVTCTGLSACGSDQLFHDSSTAASRGSTQVSTEQVEQAVSQIKQAFGQNAADFDARSAITYLLFAGDLQRVAGKTGGAVSSTQAKQEFMQRKVANPSTAAVDALRSNLALNSISRDPQGRAEITRIVKAASVQVNPRFGDWDGAQGVVDTSESWIVAKKKIPAP